MLTFALAVLLTQSSEQALAEIQRSHIDANVPVPADFDRLLSRDLKDYLAKLKGHEVRAEYEPLRRGPTQSGISYPKFYVWVRVFRGDALIEEGAARVAAVERRLFDVTDYVPERAIRSSPEDLYGIFPAPVADKIKTRLGLE